MEKHEATELMKQIAKDAKKRGADKEALHMDADKILCDFLRLIGHAGLADAFEDASEYFWYA